MTDWINKPFLDAINYFTSMNSIVLDNVIAIGTILGTLGIVWNCIQLAFGTMESRKFIVGTITKFLLFMIVLNFYPFATSLLTSGSMSLGGAVSEQSKEATVRAFVQFKTHIDAVVTAEDIEMREQLAAEIANKEQLIKEQELNANNRYYVGSMPVSLGSGEIDNRIAEAEAVIQNRLTDPSSARKTAEAINAILKPKSYDPSTGVTASEYYDSYSFVSNEDLTHKYFIDLQLKDSNGVDTGYLSPSSILKIGILCAQLIWEKEWMNVKQEWAVNDNVDPTNVEKMKSMSFLEFPFYRIFDMFLTFISMIAIVIIIIGILIQYIMCIIEFTIVTVFGAFCIPFMLFDGLKDIANKLIPALLAQAAKLVMITVTLYYAVWIILDVSATTIGGTSGFNLTTFGYVIFALILAAAVCLNAPKIAMSLMTGQPQLSMGEFLAVAGSAVAGVKATQMAAKNGVGLAQAGVSGASSAANFGMNRLGDAAAMAGAGAKGWSDAKTTGRSSGYAFSSALSSAGKEGLRQTGQNIHKGAHDFMHMNAKGGSGGTGAGVNPFGYEKGKYASANDNEKSTSYANARKGQDGASLTAGKFLKNRFNAGRGEIKKEDNRDVSHASYSGAQGDLFLPPPQFKLSEPQPKLPPPKNKIAPND